MPVRSSTRKNPSREYFLLPADMVLLSHVIALTIAAAMAPIIGRIYNALASSRWRWAR
ncbi:hypothetical protein [Arthrobacter mobilis]|uniref:Uncharacterized protein n=1 Tax=Arthrobacter mobilis TaxID=2724944 RepID=A0A7X6QMM0_9MICC|nr:hypothetical protein [Arthrobacter mobilis]NKX56851.1 hypothetical protein [Arthrobacter mobilis]